MDSPAIEELCEEQVPDILDFPCSPTNAVDLHPEPLANLEGGSESSRRDENSSVVLIEDPQETVKAEELEAEHEEQKEITTDKYGLPAWEMSHHPLSFEHSYTTGVCPRPFFLHPL